MVADLPFAALREESRPMELAAGEPVRQGYWLSGIEVMCLASPQPVLGGRRGEAPRQVACTVWVRLS